MAEEGWELSLFGFPMLYFLFYVLLTRNPLGQKKNNLSPGPLARLDLLKPLHQASAIQGFRVSLSVVVYVDQHTGGIGTHCH